MKGRGCDIVSTLYLGEERVGHRGTAHRRSGVSGHGLLDDVSRQDPNGVDRLWFIAGNEGVKTLVGVVGAIHIRKHPV